MKNLDILLIDDDELSNIYTVIKIKEFTQVPEVSICYNGEQALEYIKSKMTSGAALPDYIFLDIHMPIMNGLEFLEEYQYVEKKSKIIMLSTSILEEERAIALKYDFVVDFINKPLKVELMKEIFSRSTVQK
ncbi:response regulator [Flammeovirga sp. SubArs3]|uniref:response regulator n=1 Tax=Flammeovirga sp. SubArs3 TaxID=2995316 RepID=UPI00248B15CB|nr:response regulator [Flammeovirga sp. SubArs3]